jgi:N-acetylglutamate synthase-like GNAT family acetyltransferase
MNIFVNQTQAADLPAVLDLLERNALPVKGLAERANALLTARDGTLVIGCAALEFHGTVALLRVVVVHRHYRGRGIGQRLTQAALTLAQCSGMREIFLLAEDAQDFFPRFGFTPITPNTIPETLQESMESIITTPSKALVMRLRLR